MLFLRIVFISIIIGVSTAFYGELPALRVIFSSIGIDDPNNVTYSKDIAHMTAEELGKSRGQCFYDFHDIIRNRDKHECDKNDIYIMHLLRPPRDDTNRKPPIMVKCLQQEVPKNATANNTLLMMESVKDIVALLKPIGNATKRHQPGSCVVVIFYTKSSIGCAHVAPYANMLPHLFPTLSIAAIDAFKFSSFNTEFGIVGLPTLLLFHQGRPIVKFYSDVGTFAAFVTTHTGIKAVVPAVEDGGLKGPLPLRASSERDIILIVAWAFILLCVGNYLAKSRLCKQIVEMIKRNWLESEAQMDQN